MIFLKIFTVVIFPLIILKSIKKMDCESTYLLGRRETDVIRGVSAIFIIESHFLAWAIEMGAEVNKILQLIIAQLGGIGVLLFFFVSGYGIYVSYAKEKSGWEFIRKRLENVYIPYVFMKVILLFLFCRHEKIDNLSGKIVGALLLEDWFIRVIVLQYFSYFFLRKVLGLQKKKLILGGLIFDCILSYVFVIKQRPLGWFNALWLFTAGFVIAEYKEELIKWFKRGRIIKCFVLFIAFFISGVLFAYYKDEIFWINIFKIISGCFLSILICGILRKVSLKSNILSYVGERSMYYYIVHLNIWKMLSQLKNINIKIVIAYGVTIILSELLFYSYKKLKGIVYEGVYGRKRIN